MSDQVKRKRGGQLTYNQETAHAICVRLARGESLRSICRQEGFPPESTVRRWALEDHDGFAAHYALSRQLGLDNMAEQLLQIADDGSRDYKLDSHGNLVVDHEHIARCRLRIDTRKWLLARMAPKKYGDRVNLNVGGQSENPVAADIKWEK
jgi:terminase small subunit-like protein